MYQAVHPDREMSPQPATGTFARRVNANSRDDLNTPLPPFRHEDGSYFTSTDVSSADSIWDFGYAYSEVPASYRGDPEGLSSFTTSRINALYGSGSSSNAKRSTEKGGRREWICHVTFDATEIEGSAEVQVYFDKSQKKYEATPSYGSSLPEYTEAAKYSNATGTYEKDAHYVGACSSFQDETTKMNMPMDITGVVYLTDSLLEAGCASLEPKDVVPFLKSNLKWYVKKGGQEEIPLSKVPSLKVGVSSAEVTYPKEDTKLPVYGEFETHYDVTEKKKCGFTKGDENLVDSKPALPVKGDSNDTPVDNSPVESSYPDNTKEPMPTTTSCSTEVNGHVTTVHVTQYTTVCPYAACPVGGPVTTAFTSIYPTVTPSYAVY